MILRMTLHGTSAASADGFPPSCSVFGGIDEGSGALFKAD